MRFEIELKLFLLIISKYQIFWFLVIDQCIYFVPGAV